MVKNFDHVTIVVRDLEAAKRFFGLLGFELDQSVVISGPVFSDYMGIPDIKADHVTLVLTGANPREEVQLLHYQVPDAEPNPNIEVLDTIGFNHICFAVEDLESEVERLRAAGVETRNDVLKFHGRKLVFLRGPEGITVELSERHNPGATS
jgi:catechol 2,3-dioxygenase-like lactoylglutathione lyase family enzyme